MVVYGAFSSAVVAGLWQQVSGITLIYLTLACSVLLTVVMLLALYLPKWLGFNQADQITIFFVVLKNFSEWCSNGSNSFYWAAFGDDCITHHDFPPNSVDGLWGNCESLVKINAGIVRKI